MDNAQNKKEAGKYDWLILATKATRWQKGQSGNPGGRPKNSLKSFTALMLSKMSPKEKLAFLNEVSKEVAWKMGEGNPEQEFMGKDGKDLIPDTEPLIKELTKTLNDIYRSSGK